MEPPGGVPPPDRDKYSVVHQQPNINTPTAQQNLTIIGVSTAGQQSLEKLSRPASFDKMEALVREMQDPENGVPVRQQKMFLTSIPYAFMGYDLIEWLMDRLAIEESEALSIANQLCLHGYFFPVNDTKSLIVKDDSSLYRFQTPYYWPWQHKAPDNIEYAIYLCKRSLRNKQRHGLEDYESEALASLHKNLKGKWDFISMQAEEQVRLAKERKKGDKIVGDSQERAYWRVHRPPPGQFTPLEPCPVPSRDRQGIKPKKRTVEDCQREVDYLKKSLGRTRMKMSQVCESLVNYWETFAEYDFFLQPVLPSNPWVSEDTTFWQLNNAIVDVPTEKRVKRWSISVEELVSDPTGLQEFTTFLEKEYSHENIRFWIAVNRLRRSAHSQVPKKVNEIYEEFLKPGAPCEINIDGKTMEIVQKGLKNPSRFTFDAAAEHIYMLLLKKDCYPRFIRSDHYKSLLASGIQPSHKKRFFGFGGVAKKKSATAAPQSQGYLSQSTSSGVPPPPGSLSRRRGSDRSLTGSAHELAVIGVMGGKDSSSKVPHSHSQSNLSEIPYREPTKLLAERLETTVEAGACAVCPWETSESEPTVPEATVVLSVCPWEDNPSSQSPQSQHTQRNTSTSSDISEVSERMRRSCGLRQNTVDSDYSSKRLMPQPTEQRRASMTMAPRVSDFQFAPTKQNVTRASTTPSPTAVSHSEEQTFPPSVMKKPAIDTQIECSAVISEENSASSDNRDESKITDESDEKCSKPSELIAKDSKIDNFQIISREKESVGLNLNTELTSVIISSKSHGKTTPTIQIMCPLSAYKNEKPEKTTKTEESLTDEKIEVDVDVSNENDNLLQQSSSTPADVEIEEVSSEVIPQEELSPTMEEYQECAQFVDRADVYEYEVDVESNLTPGCVAPAPTPAPSLAPLAEIEMDPMEEEQECIEMKAECSGEETKKKRKKRDSDAKKSDEKIEEKTEEKKEESKDGEEKSKDEKDRNAVCPWEDEDGKDDSTFVKTYATLGYL